MSNNQDNQLEPGTSISLESINQKHRNKQRLEAAKTKAKSLLKLNKSAGPGRDHLGRFSGNGLKSSRFGKPAVLSALLIFAVVGGYFVYQSFAGSPLYAYQYSVYQCSGFDKARIKPNDKCVNESAEALTYRYYKGVLQKEPDSSGFAYWTQKFAGDRIRPTDAADKFVGASKTASAKSNQAFVEGVYNDLLGRKVDASGLKYWKGQLDSKKWSKGKFIAHFASQDAAKNASQAAFAAYVAKVPRVTIVENAKNDRNVRLIKSASNAREAEKLYNTIKSYPANAKNAVNTAKASASKSAPSLNDLKAIGANEKTVRDYATKTNSPRNKLAEYLRQNKEWYERAKAVAAYSPDISADGIKQQYDLVARYTKEASTINTNLTNNIKDIAALYKTAVGKYQAEQKRLAEAAQRKAEEEARRRTDNGGGTTKTTCSGSSCKQPSSYVAPSVALCFNHNLRGAKRGEWVYYYNADGGNASINGTNAKCSGKRVKYQPGTLPLKVSKTEYGFYTAGMHVSCPIVYAPEYNYFADYEPSFSVSYGTCKLGEVNRW